MCADTYIYSNEYQIIEIHDQLTEMSPQASIHSNHRSAVLMMPIILLSSYCDLIAHPLYFNTKLKEHHRLLHISI